MNFSHDYIKIGFFPLAVIYFFPLGSFAGDLLPSDSLNLGSSHLVKLVIPQPASSNRFEYDYIFPLLESNSERFFIDQKFFVTQKPLGNSDSNGLINSYGQSSRIGVRSLFDVGNSFHGVSLGYDSLWNQGSYFHQFGFAFEYTKQDYQLVLTAGIPISHEQFGDVPLTSVNFQISLPTSFAGLAFQPRIYLVSSDSTGSAVGGQLQLTYSFDSTTSATIASNYDPITGSSGSLTFQTLFPGRSNTAITNLINPNLLNSFAGAVGNNGSRIIRLADNPDASGN